MSALELKFEKKPTCLDGAAIDIHRGTWGSKVISQKNHKRCLPHIWAPHTWLWDKHIAAIRRWGWTHGQGQRNHSGNGRENESNEAAFESGHGRTVKV
jgi:hypothetical protein